MGILRRLGRLVWAAWSRRQREAGPDDGVRSRAENETEENARRGLAFDEERRGALATTGGGVAREGRRQPWGVRQFETLSQDVRYALRGLRRNPGYAAVALVTLALGIGANTAIFSVVNAVLLQPLPYDHGSRLVHLVQSSELTSGRDVGVSFLELEDYRARAHSLETVAEYHSMTFTLLGGDEPLRVRTGVVSADFFAMLGVVPGTGRGFRAGEDAEGAEPVLLLGHRFWSEQLGGDPGVVGRHFEMNDRVHTVVGVLPPLPGYPDENDVYMPASSCPFRTRPEMLDHREMRMMRAFALLRPGVDVRQAQSEVAAVAAAFPGEHPEAYSDLSGFSAHLVTVSDEVTRDARPTFLLLLGTVGLVLLLACANVANLSLARLATRSHELAVRTALGAGRVRITRQLVTESTLLALGGGALGLGVAASGLGLLTRFAAQYTPRAGEIALDAPVLAFTLLVSLVTGLVFGALPGVPGGDDVRDSLQDRSHDTGLRLGRFDLRRSLVVTQLALSFVVLMTAALALRSLVELQGVDPGFRTDHVLSARLDPNWSRYADPRRPNDPQKLAAFYEPILRHVQGLPGVRSASVSWTFPLNSTFRMNGSYLVEGLDSGNAPPRADYRAISPDYFETLGIPVVTGRAFDAGDTAEAPPVVIVSRSVAERLWSTGQAVGHRISVDGGQSWSTVVGVAGDVRQYRLDELPTDVVYVPFAANPGISATVLVRSTRDPVSLGRELRGEVVRTDPETAVTQVRSLDDVRDAALASPRLLATLLGLFASLALAITAAGVGGVLAFTVSRRTREIGVRMALGARPASVVGMIVRQGMSSALFGLALGAVGSLATGRLMAGILFGVGPSDLVCFACSAVVFLVVAGIASVVPAWRATSIDPLVALRAS